MAAQIRVSRDTLARMLRCHGEDALAERAPSVTDAELTRIRELGAYYAFSKRALATGSMGGPRACSLAAVEVLEGAPRELRQVRTELELKLGSPEALTGEEIARDRDLRLHAAEELQQPHC